MFPRISSKLLSSSTTKVILATNAEINTQSNVILLLNESKFYY